MKNYFWLSISIIVFLAFFLRFNKVTSDPPALNWDEVSIGYNANSILKTGRDEWGKFLPINFKSYGEYKLPVQIYASVPGIAIFGLNELGVRITPVVYGTLTVLLLFFLVYEMFDNVWMALISSFLLAVSPWHIQLTRASFESSFSVFWVTLGVLLFVKGFKNSKYWFWSIFPFIISIYTYNSARVFTPIFLLSILFIYRKEIFKNIKVVLLSLTVFIIAMIPLITFFISGEATARLKLVSITDDPGFTQRINQARGASHLPAPLPKLIHNKVTHYAYVFVGNYLSHFSPDFLFVNGAGHKQHHVQGIGELYAVQAPFILIGLYVLFKRKNKSMHQNLVLDKWRWLIISWLLLTFIPVSVTIDSIPNALRTLLAVIPYEIITAIGIWELIRYRIIIAMSAVIFAISFTGYLNNYYNTYPNLYSRDWQYGYKQVVTYIKDHYNEYDLIVFSRTYGEPHMFTLFYLNWNPDAYQNDPKLNRFETYNWVRVLNFDKFYFPDLGDDGTRYLDTVKVNPGKKILFVGKESDFPDSSKRLLIIRFLNGDRAFDIVESK